jgi:hypothetical protein
MRISWVERLRVVGIDRQGPSDGSDSSPEVVTGGMSESPVVSANLPIDTPSKITTSPKDGASPSPSFVVDENSSDSERDAPPKKTPKMDPHR